MTEISILYSLTRGDAWSLKVNIGKSCANNNRKMLVEHPKSI